MPVPVVYRGPAHIVWVHAWVVDSVLLSAPPTWHYRVEDHPVRARPERLMSQWLHTPATVATDFFPPRDRTEP